MPPRSQNEAGDFYLSEGDLLQVTDGVARLFGCGADGGGAGAVDGQLEG